MQNTNIPLSTIGLIMPSDFPVTLYESIHKRAARHSHSSTETYLHFAGAWNAVAYRFDAVNEYQTLLIETIDSSRHGVIGPERSRQERNLFGFFCNGFSVFEAASYGLFSFGALACPAGFPIATEGDQKRIGLVFTARQIEKVFAGDPILDVIARVRTDSAYVEWSEMRHVLTHRSAPGRTLSVGGDETARWKLKNIPLNAAMAPAKRSELSRLLVQLLNGIDEFAVSRV